MSATLDATDLVLLDVLQRQPLVRFREMAKISGKSSSIVFERLRRLRNIGVISKIVAVLDARLVKRGLTVFAFVRLKEHSKKTMVSFGKEVAALDEVMEAYHMSGHGDFLLKIAVADMEEFNHFINSRLSAFKDIASVNSRFVMKEVKNEKIYALTALDLPSPSKGSG